MEVMRRWTLVLIVVNVLVVVGLAFIYPHLMLSPGPPAASHADLTTNCFACHAPWRGADSQRCMACHVPADIGLRTTRGLPLAGSEIRTAFHQELISQECMACHVEHEGSRMTGRGNGTFSHAMLRVATRGQCASCHAAPADSMHRKLGAACSQCHRTEQWKPATFDHAGMFLLDGDHNAECATCHVENDYRRYTCYGCHEHQPARIRAEHLEEGIRDFEDCVKCHRNASDEPEERGSGEGRDRD